MKSLAASLVLCSTTLVCSCGDNKVAAIPVEHYDTPLWVASGDIVGVGAVRVLSDERVILGDFGEKELWLIDADGKNIRSIGQHGSGPLEFKSVRGVLPLPGDSTLVIDSDQRRMLILDENANPVRVVGISEKVPQTSFGNNSGKTDSRGRMVMPSSFMRMSEEKDVALLRWDWKADHLDTITRVSVPPSHMVKTKTLMTVYMVPYSETDWFHPLPDGETAILRGKNYRVDFVDTLGHLRQGDTVSYVPVAVADTERKEVNDILRTLMPDKKAPFDGSYAMVSPEGELWVRRTTAWNADSIDYDILNKVGKHVRTIRLPLQTWVLAITPKRVYISHINDDGFEVLQAHARK